MPPLPSSDDESVGDIPYKKPEVKETKGRGGKVGKGKGKGKGKAEPVEESKDEDEDMEEAEDEYAVEEIKSHRFEPDGTLKLEVKWIGFPSSQNTWEPEDNLDGCPEELKNYYTEIGGKPVFGAAKNRASSSAAKASKKRGDESSSTPASSKPVSKKRGAESTPMSEKSASKRGSRAQKKLKLDEEENEAPDSAKTNDKTKFEPPKGDWEDDLIEITTVDLDEKGKLQAYVTWRDMRRTCHPTSLLNKKCPQRMLEFYEAHLPELMKLISREFKKKPQLPVSDKFTLNTQENDTVQDAAIVGADMMLESAEDGVKNVASSVTKNIASAMSAVKNVVAKTSTTAAATPKSAVSKATTPKSSVVAVRAPPTSEEAVDGA